jgi:hypothetical protein
MVILAVPLRENYSMRALGVRESFAAPTPALATAAPLPPARPDAARLPLSNGPGRILRPEGHFRTHPAHLLNIVKLFGTSNPR